MQAVSQNVDAGLKAPDAFPKHAVALTAILLSSGLAAMVFQVARPGSAVALCFVLPFIFLLMSWFSRLRSARAHLLPVATLTALLGVALEPGFLNITLTTLLMSATAIAARSAREVLPWPVLVATARGLFSAPWLMALDTAQAATHLRAHVTPVQRPPMVSIVLPVMAVGVFTLLLAFANPLIANALLSLPFDQPVTLFGNLLDTIFNWSGFVFLLTACLLWPMLRGSKTLQQYAINPDATAPLWHRMFFKPGAVVVTLVLLNFLFATENTLDIWHVWMEAKLPDGMTHAAYVHRGAYTLIVTALLAGVLVVLALRKGTATEQSPPVRSLAYVWTAQNLLLVASSAKRTFDYIGVYNWTEWRLAGLLWMGLVFVGLVSIIWRMVKNLDSRWLININLLVMVSVLLFSALADMRGFIARQNLASSNGTVDFQYLMSLGPSSIRPLLAFAEAREHSVENAGLPQTPGMVLLLAEQAKSTAAILAWQNANANGSWRSWTWRFAGL
jgi:Domain of unknown function (DUF4173)